jgi:hypothetical protein
MTSPIYKDRTSRAKAIGILIVQVLISVAVGAWVFMQTFSVAGCGDSCSYGLVSGAWQALLWVSVGVPVVSLVSIILLYERGRDSWWVPTVGIVVVLITGIACTVAIDVGTAI